MQEQMNKAMSSLSETVGQEVPTFNEVRDKIEGRYARAKGMSELTDTSTESRMIEIESAAANFEAQDRLAKIRESLGIDTAEAPATPAVETPAVATEPATDPSPQQSPGV